MHDGRAEGERGRLLAAMELARRFHATYARLAPAFGEGMDGESAVPWEEVPERRKRLLVAVCSEIQGGDEPGFAPLRGVVMGVKRAWVAVCACHDALDGDDSTEACGEAEDRFDAAIMHLVAALDEAAPDAPRDAPWDEDGDR